MDLRSINLEFQAVLMSFEAKNTHLIYKKGEGFSTIGGGSVRSFNKGEYVVDAPLVHERVNDFIKTNQALLRNIQLEQLKKNLTHQIQKINTKTSGLLNLLFYLFNPESKSKLLEEKQRMENLKQTIEDSLKNPVRRIEPIPVRIEPINKEIQEKLGLQPNKNLMGQMDLVSEEKIDSPPQSPQQSSQPSPFNTPPKPPVNQQVPIIPTPLTPIGQPNILSVQTTPSNSTPEIPTTPFAIQTPPPPSIQPSFPPDITPPPETPSPHAPPPPPPPPPAPTPPHQNQLIHRNHKGNALFPNEPSLLNFDRRKFENLENLEIKNQIQQITDYLTKMKAMFMFTLSPNLKEYQGLKANSDLKYTRKPLKKAEKLEEIEGRLQELERHLKQCRTNLKELEEGKKTGKVVYLKYKNSKEDYLPFPFFPDQMYDTIYKENQEVLKAKLGAGKLNTDDNDQPPEPLEDDHNAIKNMFLQKFMNTRRLSISGLMELQDENNPLQPQLLYSPVKLSVAIDHYKDRIDEHIRKIAAIKAGQTKKQSSLEKILKDIKMTVAELKEVVEYKTKLIDDWERSKNSREQLINKREEQKNLLNRVINDPKQTPQIVKKDPKQIIGIDDKYPDLKVLIQLPQHIQAQIRSEAKKNGLPLSDFEGSLYQKLYSEV